MIIELTIELDNFEVLTAYCKYRTVAGLSKKHDFIYEAIQKSLPDMIKYEGVTISSIEFKEAATYIDVFLKVSKNTVSGKFIGRNCIFDIK